MKKLLIILFLCGCSNLPSEPDVFEELKIASAAYETGAVLMVSDGYSHFDSNTITSFSHITIIYFAPPLTRVFWFSPDSFDVIHRGITIKTSVVDFSTYADSDGFGKQMIYVSTKMVGDTLDIHAYSDVGEDIIRIIID